MGRMNILRFLREQWTIIPKASTNETSTDSYGKTIIVTGATSGLGLEAAKQFHDLPSTTVAKLILTSKDMSKVEEAEKFVAGHNSAKSNYWANLDLTSFRSVSAFVDALGPAQDIHCLLANAALATHKYTQTPDGWESALQVNYLSNVLLCILLLPNLVKASAPSAPSRLVLVSSDVHYSLSSQAFEFFRTTPNILEAASRKEYCTASVMRQRTILSKFLVISFARELASRLLPEVNIVISSVNPGFCYSKLTRETEAHFPGNIWVPLLKAAVARPAEVGGSVLVRATLMLGAHTGDGGLAEWHGRYLSSCLGVAEESDLLLGDSGEAFSRKLWDDTVSILEKIDPRIKEILQLYTVYG